MGMLRLIITSATRLFTVMRIQIGASPFFRSFAFLMMNNTLSVFLFTAPIILCFLSGTKLVCYTQKPATQKADNQRQMRQFVGAKTAFKKSHE